MEKSIIAQALINYLKDHIKVTEGYGFKGFSYTYDFSFEDLLKVVYYLDPELFNEITAQAKGENDNG